MVVTNSKKCRNHKYLEKKRDVFKQRSRSASSPTFHTNALLPHTSHPSQPPPLLPTPSQTPTGTRLSAPILTKNTPRTRTQQNRAQISVFGSALPMRMQTLMKSLNVKTNTKCLQLCHRQENLPQSPWTAPPSHDTAQGSPHAKSSTTKENYDFVVVVHAR